jgi:hypothetical protein
MAPLSVDRLPLNEQTMTVEFIVNMLGVPRAGMTEAPDLDDVIRFNEAIDQALAESAAPGSVDGVRSCRVIHSARRLVAFLDSRK